MPVAFWRLLQCLGKWYRLLLGFNGARRNNSRVARIAANRSGDSACGNSDRMSGPSLSNSHSAATRLASGPLSNWSISDLTLAFLSSGWAAGRIATAKTPNQQPATYHHVNLNSIDFP